MCSGASGEALLISETFTPAPGAVSVEAYARLHFGVLDLRGARGRWFGGIGAAVSAPSVQVTAARADRLAASGDDAARAALFAQRFFDHHAIGPGARVHVTRVLPSHVGLGSGTQLALAVARALAGLYGTSTDPRDLARAVGRGRRSAIGTWTFAGGGLVVEGGRARDRDDCGPLVARLPFPPSWRALVVVPDAPPGVSGPDEAEAFALLPAPSEREVEHVSYVTLMSLLPALADADLAAFGCALTEIQQVTGRWFASAQGGTFASGASRALVEQLAAWGAAGVGQSSWGPAVYGVVDGDEAATTLAARARAAVGPRGRVFHGPFRSAGARVWCEPG